MWVTSYYLRDSALEDIRFGTDMLSGEVKLDSAGVLCVAVPYSKGWQVYTDGNAGDVLCVNEHYMGTALAKGEHTVEFRYDTPYKKQGLIMTVIGIVLFICISVFEKRGGRRA